jgi:hypothetical protein
MHYGPDGQFVGAERAEDVALYRAIAQLAREPAERGCDMCPPPLGVLPLEQ